MYEFIVYGPGCANCSNTENLIRQVLTAQNLPFTLKKVTDYQEMAIAGVLSTPTVTLNGKVMTKKAKVPTEEEVNTWLKSLA
ncbi:hypothetical protein BegalDRAFT_3093 [Beggiatoa alba B18LD]|uniref:Thioredoxin-like fold domain-containing protein n=2 Tax=Beggiatoa alba TaxID=1022 RepID=I3CJX5_9GAMM|nr:hypothetical protein BegalDRAFT_3093 [Beggiatoa alba B18LD]